MKKESNRLKDNVEKTYDRYISLPEETASLKLTESKWSIKEIIGHLVDSAANNYQRFIRLQETDGLEFPGYPYDWINIVPYGTYPYRQIMELWKQYNLLLCHIVNNIEERHLNNRWLIEGNGLTLGFLVKDYNDHMELHLEQLEERLVEVNAAMGPISYKAIKVYDDAPENPIRLVSGESVEVLNESDPCGDWPNWLFCRSKGIEGWVPKQIIKADGETGLVIENYEAVEFNLVPGEIILAEKELNGWIWGTRKGEPDKYGWAPLNCLERMM